MDVNNAVPPILPRWSTTPLGGRVARTLRVGDALGARVVRGVGPPGVLTRSGPSALPQHRGRSEGIAAEALAHGVDRRGDRLPRRAVGGGSRRIDRCDVVEDAPRRPALRTTPRRRRRARRCHRRSPACPATPDVGVARPTRRTHPCRRGGSSDRSRRGCWSPDLSPDGRRTSRCGCRRRPGTGSGGARSSARPARRASARVPAPRTCRGTRGTRPGRATPRR